MEELPAMMYFGSNRAFERDVLTLLLRIHEFDDNGLTLLEAGVVPTLMKAIQFVDDPLHASEMLPDMYGNESLLRLYANSVKSTCCNACYGRSLRVVRQLQRLVHATLCLLLCIHVVRTVLCVPAVLML